MQKLRQEYDMYRAPEDVRIKPETLDYVRSYKQFNPARVLDDEEGDHHEGTFDENPPIGERSYSKPRAAPELSQDDSAKFGGSAPIVKF